MLQLLATQIYSVILLIVLLCFSLTSYDRKKRLNQVFLELIIAELLMFVSFIVQMILRKNHAPDKTMIISISVSFIFLTVTTVIFAAYYYERLSQKGLRQKIFMMAIYLLSGIYTIFLIINMFVPIVFYTNDGSVVFAKFGLSIFGIYYLIYPILLISFFLSRKKMEISEVIIFTITVLLMITENFMGATYNYNLMGICPTTMLFVMFITFHIRKSNIIEKTTNAISNTHIAIYYIDLINNEFDEIHALEHIHNAIGSRGSAQEVLNKSVTDYFCIETFIPRMLDFVNLGTIEERLKGKKIVSEEFEGPTAGWCRSSLIPAEYDKKGKLTKVLYTVQRINGEILSLRGQLEVEETILECVRTLSRNTEPDKSINQLLANVATYHKADRAYIFEFDSKKQTVSNTFEWCKNGVEPEIEKLQNLKVEEIQLFIDLCKSGVLNLSDINYFSKDSEEYKLLKMQNIISIMCVPLMKDEEMIGFIGVDNLRQNKATETILKSVASFIITELQKKEFVSELYDLSFKDMMTGVFNRHASMRDIGELENKKISNLGIIYGDINGLKETNDKFDHEHGDKLIINAANMLKKYYNREDDKIYRIGGDEFIVICKNIPEDVFNENYNNLIKELGSDYILSTGKFWISECQNIEEHIKSAEQGMYASKRNYYQTHDRRARRS